MDFYPRPPGGGRHFSSSARSSYSDFYPRPPGGGRQRRPRCLSATKNFYPRPPGGGRPAPKPPLIHTQRFLSTPSGWRATVVLEDHKVVEAGFLSTPSGWRATTPSQMPFSNEKFLSTPSGWRATCPKAPAHPHAAISIHALRVEGDCSSRGSQGRRGRISIHALRVEGDKRLYCFGVLKAYFYPRPPGGGRH